MFANIVVIVLVIVLAGVVAHWTLFAPKGGQLFDKQRNQLFDPLRYLILLVLLMLPEQKHNIIGILRKLAYILAFISAVVLGITGFWHPVARDSHVSGYLLMIHATFGPIFAACMAFLAVFWAERCKFNRQDCPAVKTVIDNCDYTVKKAAPNKTLWLWQKILFWAILALSPVVILSIVLTMFDLAGTHWQELLLSAHRYTSLAWIAGAIMHSYSIWLIKAREIAGD